jgi:ERF superfamily
VRKISEAIRAPELAPPGAAPAAQLPAVHQPGPDSLVSSGPAPRPTYPPKIAKSILAITREVGHVEKRGRHEFHKFKYPTWEDVIEALSPLLAEHGLICIQAEKSRHLIEDNDKGSTLSVVYGFSFVNEDGETWPEVEWTALARLRDQKGITDDKAATKCHSQAEKFFLMKQFKIRTEDETPDSDLPKKDVRPHYEKLCKEIMACDSEDAMRQWSEAEKDRIALLPRSWRDMLRVTYGEKLAEFKGGPKARSPGEVASDEWGDRQGDNLRKAMADDRNTVGGIETDEDECETGVGLTKAINEVLWEDAPPPPGTVAEQSKWSTLSAVQQAGIRCKDTDFQRFLAEEYVNGEVGEMVAVRFIRQQCRIDSRAELLPGSFAETMWRKIDDEFIAWKRQ